MLVSAILCVLIGKISIFITIRTNRLFTKVSRPVNIILLVLVVYVHSSPKLLKKSKAKLSVAHKPFQVIGRGRWVSIFRSLFGHKDSPFCSAPWSISVVIDVVVHWYLIHGSSRPLTARKLFFPFPLKINTMLFVFHLELSPLPPTTSGNVVCTIDQTR